MVSKTAVVDLAEHVQRQFASRLERYRSLVRESVASGGSLAAAEAEELLQVARELGLPADRLGDDQTAVIAERNLQERLDAVVSVNVTPTADVPLLEAEVAELGQRLASVTRKLELERAAIEQEMATRRAAIAAEHRRPRQSTASLEAQLRRLREANPVMFRPGLEAAELPVAMQVRQRVFGDV